MRTKPSRNQNPGHTHALTPNDIGKPTKNKLAEKIADWSGNFDTKILVYVQYMVMAINIAQHLRGNVDGEDIVADNPLPIRGSNMRRDLHRSRVSEEASACDTADFDVEPAIGDNVSTDIQKESIKFRSREGGVINLR